MEWLKQQGPWCPALIDHLRRQHQQYDVLIFFTYLYATTVLGLEVEPGRSVLVPTAHDEPAIRLDIFKDVFSRAAALCYLTESEKQFVQRQFPDRPLLEEVDRASASTSRSSSRIRGCRRLRKKTRPTADERRRTAPGDGETERSRGRGGARDFPSHLLARGSVFRRRHRLHGPIALYGGRIDPGKGCEELIEYFSSYVKDGGDATLALMGVKLMALPEEPFIRFAGLLSESERIQALEAATVVVCPSPYESLSLLALEAHVGRHAGPGQRPQRRARRALRAQQRRAVVRRPRRIRRVPEPADGRRAPARRAGPERPRLRPWELSVGRRARKVRAHLREDRDNA